MSSEESIVILSDVNLASFGNINETDEGREASMPELIATLSYWLVDVVCVQLCTPA